VIIQSLFLRGEHEGEKVDNTDPGEIEAWIVLLKQIIPEYVMIYPIDRATPAQNLEKVSFEELTQIAEQVNHIGIKTKVFG